MQVGDILTGDQLDKLPVGSVVVHDEVNAFNTVTRTMFGYAWTDGLLSGAGSTVNYGHGGIVTNHWTLVHLPESAAG